MFQNGPNDPKLSQNSLNVPNVTKMDEMRIIIIFFLLQFFTVLWQFISTVVTTTRGLLHLTARQYQNKKEITNKSPIANNAVLSIIILALPI